MSSVTVRIGEEFLSSWADDELLVGQHIADRLRLFCVPTVEEYLALASIGQDEMGHADLIMGFFLPDGRSKERYVYERGPAEFRACALARLGPEVNNDWARVVARGWLYDCVELARIRLVMRLQPGDALAEACALMEREESEHLRHWEAWIATLAAHPEGRSRLQDALEALAPFVGGFAFPGGPGLAREAQAEWGERVLRFLESVGIDAPSLRQALERPGPARDVLTFADTVRAMQEAYHVEPGNVWG
jgi:1,2-phenylacetyl-CoA epoxidase catalytic subunit